jgi:glycosyltransferase involved in cell wall biosynthesis
VSDGLSLVVTAYNEEQHLPRTLAGAAGLAAETLVVIDPRTTDRSRELAAAAGARVLEHPFESCGAQCAWGVAAARHDWVLVLDADERPDECLRASIVATVAAPRSPAYAARRANLAFGRRLRFGDWGRDRVVRLFDRRRAAIAGGMHWTVRAASIGLLSGVLEHDTLRDLASYLPRLHAYAAAGAAESIRAGRRAGALTAPTRAAWRFARAALLRLGALDGGAGLIVAGLAGWGTFLKWSLVWEAQHRRSGGA